jgi:glycerol-3-phosphate dehydrogenase
VSRLQVDVVILGGGIAGLWLLSRLRVAGFSALLLEAGELGGGQTLRSQGIIHGGTKYALTGELTASSGEVAAMPVRWRACLEGRGELDLSGVRLLSPFQYLWSTSNLASRMAGFFAGKVMRSRVEPLAAGQRPGVFRTEGFKGAVYRLDEPVLDVPSLVVELARQNAEHLLKIEWPDGCRLQRGPDGGLQGVELTAGGERLVLDARRYVFAAGAGNAALLAAAGLEEPSMQRRPLHMLMARGDLPGLYAHCLGASANPRVTITTHRRVDGERVWYIGGQIAETGVERTPAEQAQEGLRELSNLLPWIDFTRVRWASFLVDRAEPRQPGGKRPDRPYAEPVGNVIVTWPTKLALAPRLADDVMAILDEGGVAPRGDALLRLDDWPRPATGSPPWEDDALWN